MEKDVEDMNKILQERKSKVGILGHVGTSLASGIGSDTLSQRSGL
jgi:hypothetical protein